MLTGPHRKVWSVKYVSHSPQLTGLDPSLATKLLRQVLKWLTFFNLNPLLVLALSLQICLKLWWLGKIRENLIPSLWGATSAPLQHQHLFLIENKCFSEASISGGIWNPDLRHLPGGFNFKYREFWALKCQFWTTRSSRCWHGVVWSCRTEMNRIAESGPLRCRGTEPKSCLGHPG